MRRLAPLVLAACAVAGAQVLVESAHAAAARKAFERDAGQTLQCEFHPLKPSLGFSFRFLSGYEVRVPMSQYRGPGHGWAVMLRVTPEGGEEKYLASMFDLPPVPETRQAGEVSGGFLTGEGRYQVAAVLADDLGRTCRADWRIEARLDASQQHLRLGLAPGSVSDLRPVRLETAAPSGGFRIARLTVLMHAAPLRPMHSLLSPADILMQTGSLASLMEQLRADSMRLVVFNLNQQRVLMRKEEFAASDVNDVARTLNQLQLGTIPLTVLRDPTGEMRLLADLVNESLTGAGESDAVVVLGPESRHVDRIPREWLVSRGQRRGGLYYLQFRMIRPPLRAGDPLPPPEIPRGMRAVYGNQGTRALEPTRYEGSVSGQDAIGQTVGHLKGRTFLIQRPADFAAAIRKMKPGGKQARGGLP